LGATPAQAAIAWVAAKGGDIVPLIGARSTTRLAEAIGAVDLQLNPGEVDELASLAPAGAMTGAAFPADQRRPDDAG
jgi:aryl-alcohol dehydrogenase-like predicted oxidoreductase